MLFTPIAAAPVSAVLPLDPSRKRGLARGRILDAATRLLRERSYDALSMEDIADAARITRRTIYNQFAGRRAVYRASREMLAKGIGSLLAREVGARGAPRTALAVFARQTMCALSDERYTDLLLSLLRDSEEKPWLEALYRSTVKGPIVDALVRYFTAMRSFVGEPQPAAYQFAGLLEAIAAAPRLFGEAASGLMPPAEAQVDALVADFVRRHFDTAAEDLAA